MTEHHEEESYRDHLATVDDKGKRIWVYPKKPKGKFTNYRTWVSYILLIILFAVPHIRIDGQPLLQLDIMGRKFIVFGNMFFPADNYIFVVITITMFVSIVLFTVAFGRIFCGWFCPQTIFMEMVYRKIEYAIEGDYKQQIKLDKQEWNFDKIWKKTLKQGLFFGIAFLIANTFLAYIIGSEKLWEIQVDDPANHITGLITITVFSFIFFFVFSKLREQVCTTICPYGRLQGVLLDKDSIVVAYDYKRGEGRAKFRKGEDRAAAEKGDCIDCNQCVVVCPTGIDIRNGTQLECINCTVCMDECDSIMDNIGFDKGLIRYASENEIADGIGFRWTVRMKGYMAVLAILFIAMSWVLTSRNDVQAILLRAPGTLYQKTEDGRFQNMYTIKLLNKTNKNIAIEIKNMSEKGEIKIVTSEIVLKPQAEMNTAMFIILDKSEIEGFKQDVSIGVYSNGELLETAGSTFIGPMTINNE